MATKYWNYSDAFAYALALNDSDQSAKLTADASRWHKAVYDLRGKYRDQLPEVFKHVFFETKNGRVPYSPQVEHFLHVQAQARLMSAPNPAYVVLEMSPTQKKTVIRLNEERLSSHRKLLEDLGRELLALVRHSD